MRTQFTSSRVLTILALSLTAVFLMSAEGEAKDKGLSDDAYQELSEANVDKYLGEFTPAVSTDVGDGWTKHTFDPDGGNGPICIAGTPFSAFTRAGSSDKVLIFLQGGGACWQDFYNCNVLSEDQEPPTPPVGIWDFDSKDNPFRGYSIVYMPYCDGSVFGGDADVVDPAFPFGTVRRHRGLRNLSAGMDVAKATFPDANKITVAGSSAGGVGAAAFAPFLARFQYGNNAKLTVFNDAGPIVVDLDTDEGKAAAAARAADWQFEQFYPASCTACSAFGQQTAIVDWRLDNDTSIREAFYETDNDFTNRFFAGVPFDFVNQDNYRNLFLPEHEALSADHPDRYKIFIVSGPSPDSTSHTALQLPLFYSQEADGLPLNVWTEDFISDKASWVPIVEDFVNAF
jgi:hypothetical protein